MPDLRRIAGSLLVLLLTAFPLLAQQWVEVRSPNFSVATDAGENRGRDVGLRFEQLRAVFATMFGREKLNMPVPLQILAFRRSKDFEQYAPRWKGKSSKLSGYYQMGEDRNFIALDLSAEDGWTVVFHEYAHLLLNGNLPGTPVWFDEGYAEYFSTVQIIGRDVQLGRGLPGRIERLRTSNLMPLPELFTIKHDSETYLADTERRDLFYAESWLMVHYVFDMNKVSETAACFDLLQQGVPVLEAIERAYKMPAAKLQRAVEDYFHSTHALLRLLKLPEKTEHVPFTTVAMNQADAQALLADLHLHEHDYHDQAIKEFEAVLRLNPDHAAANRGLGYAYLRDNDFAHAAEHFQRAAAKDSKDPRVYYYVAMLMAREAAASMRPIGDLPAMRKELETAVALDPEYADAWNLLAYVDTLEGEHEQAAAHMQRAVELSPRNELYAANLALYLMNSNQWQQAEPILRKLQHSENSEIAGNARRNLEEAGRVLKEKPPLEQARREPPLHPASKEEPAQREEPEPEPPKPAAPPPEVRPIKYLKGTLTGIDCSTASEAVLTVVAAGTTWKMRTPDRSTLLLIGVDKFSCEWKNRRVLVNYRVAGPGKADLVSLELQ